MTPSHQTHSSIAQAVDSVLAQVAGDIVLGIPLGIGKPNAFVNALYRRLKDSPRRRLRIVTALSLERPVGHSDLERHFLEPLVERVFRDYPDLDYVKDLRAGTLPAHIEVREFFMKTGDYLGNSLAQQGHICTNYTFVARDMAVQGINVIAQAVAAREGPEGQRLSLSSNPDVTFEVIEKARAAGRPLLSVAVINRQMPFMPHDAEVAPEFFDLLVDDAAATHTLFGPPNAKVSTADYAIGLHASSLVADGGTLQIGIGSLGDAIAQSLIVRHRQPGYYRRILEGLCPTDLQLRQLAPFDRGLYGCSEMFVNGFLRLMDAGVVRRAVYGDATLQRLINEGRIDGQTVTSHTISALLDNGRIGSPLDESDLSFLRRYGIFHAHVGKDGSDLVCGSVRVANDLLSPDGLEAVARHLLGKQLQAGITLHGGFFLGPGDFYERLRNMPEDVLGRIGMTRIDFINQLDGRLPGEAELKRAQRQNARFMNTVMMATLLGAAVSDGLDTGEVVSGVGGQYNFVAMAHALPDARSILMLRSTHEHKDGLRSSIVWQYGHTTIPRHLRDIVVTEYGVADLRGQTDTEVIQRMVAVADSRFQDELVRQAKAHGKLAASYEVPLPWRQNTPQRLDDLLHPWSQAAVLPDFPFGTDLSADELHIVRALKRLKRATQHPTELVTMAVKSLWEGKSAPPAYLERLGLDDARSFKQMFIRRLFAGNL